MARSPAASQRGASAKKSKRAKPKDDRPPCKGQTKAGKPCPYKAKAGHVLCGNHLRAAEGGTTGRDTKFESGRLAAILNWMQQGSYAKAAAESQGVSEATLYRWLDEGRADDVAGVDSAKREFREAFTRARAEGEVRLVGYAVAAAKNDGRVAIEMLARRNPKEWGRKRLEVTGAGGGPLEHTEQPSIDFDKLPLEKRRQLLALLDEAGASPDQGGSA